jgi:hypothetical protein
MYENEVIGSYQAWYPALSAHTSATCGLEKRTQSVPGEYARAANCARTDVNFGMRAEPPTEITADCPNAGGQARYWPTTRCSSAARSDKGLQSFVLELANSCAPRLRVEPGLDAGSTAARNHASPASLSTRDRAGPAGHAQQLISLAAGCVDVFCAHSQ